MKQSHIYEQDGDARTTLIWALQVVYKPSAERTRTP